MNRAGMHGNLPDIIQHPSLVYRHRNSWKNDATPGQSPTSTGDLAPDVQQQVVPLILEAHQENLQSERSETQDASKMGAEMTSAAAAAAAALHDGRGNNASIVLDEFKENSLPPVSYLPFTNTSIEGNGQTGFVQVMPVSCDTLATINLQPLNPTVFAQYASESSPSPPRTADGIRIDFMPIYQIMPMNPAEPAIVLPAVTTSSNTEAVIVHSGSLPLRASELPPSGSRPLRASELQPSPKTAISDPTPHGQFVELHKSTRFRKISPMISLPEQAIHVKTNLKYQCPKCLLRFDRVLAQLQHRCRPDRRKGGSLHKRRSVKLYKCLECREEFSDLERKIRHPCSAKPQADLQLISKESRKNNSLPVALESSSGEEVTQSHGRGTIWQRTSNDFVSCNICKVEVLNNKYDKALHMTNNHTNRKMSKKMKHRLFRCLVCLHAFANEENLKHHPCKRRSHKSSKVKTSDRPQEKPPRSSPSGMAIPTRTKPQDAGASSKSRDSNLEKRFKCGLCDRSYKSPGFLKSHIDSHRGSDEYKRNHYPFICQRCNGKFRFAKQLKRHASKPCSRKHNVDVKETQTSGKKVVSNSKALTTCMPKDTTQVSPKPKDSSDKQQPCQAEKCGFCNVIFDSETALRKHFRSHWVEIFDQHNKRLVCYRCYEEFDACVKLFLHVRRNTCTSTDSDTSQSNEKSEKNETEESDVGDEHVDVTSHQGDATECRNQKEVAYYCPHCSLKFWSSVILDVHLHSSHPFLSVDKEALVNSDESAEESTEAHSRESLLPSVGQTNEPGKTRRLSTHSPAHRESEDSSDTKVSRRTEMYSYHCGICNVDYPSWRHLDKHRRACHPQLVIHLQLAGDKCDPPDEASEDISADKLNDFKFPCNHCEKVFCFWRFLALHKKAKHGVKLMYARYSSSRKESSCADFEITLSGKRSFHCKPQASAVQDVDGYRQKPISSEETSHAPNDSQMTTPSLNTDMVQNQQPSPCHVTSQQDLTDVCSEVTADVAGDNDGQYSQNISSSETPRTVEDLMISSVVSLHNVNKSVDMSCERKVSPSETHSPQVIETSTWHQISSETPTPTEVRSSFPPQLQKVPDRPLTTTQDETFTLPSLSDNGQQETVYNDLLDSVLDLESAYIVNNCRPVSDAEQGTFDERVAPSSKQPEWEGNTRKISFAEAKEILKLQEKGPASKGFPCSICGEMFEHIRHFTRHTLTHCKSELYYCSFCEAKSYNVLSLLHHVTSTHDLTLVKRKGLASSTGPASLHAAGVVNQSLQDDAQISFSLSESPPDPLQNEAGQQQETGVHPRPLQDYVYKPSILEINPNFDAVRDVYECVLCHFEIKDKTEFIYHLRMHHEQTPYHCCHCHQTFSFILDFEVHFSENHSPVTPAHVQRPGACEQQTDLASDGQCINQMENASSCHPFVVQDFGTPAVWSQPIGQGELDSTSLQNGYVLNDDSSFPPFCLETTTQHHGDSVTSGCGTPSTDLESQVIISNEEMSQCAVKVKQEFTPLQNSSCMMNNSVVSQNCVNVKVEQQQVSETGSDIGVHVPSTYEGTQEIRSREEEPTSLVRVKQERFTDDEADIPCPMEKESKLNSPQTEIDQGFGNGITVKTEKLDEDPDHCIEWNEDAESLGSPIPVQVYKCTTDLSGQHQQGPYLDQSAFFSGVSNLSGKTPPCLAVPSSKKVDEEKISTERGGEPSDLIRSLEDIIANLLASRSKSSPEVNSDSSDELTVNDRLGVEDSGSNRNVISGRPLVGGTSIENGEGECSQALSESASITNPVGTEPDTLSQPMDDDLAKLASEAGITITGDASAPLEEGRHRNEQSVANTTIEGDRDDDLLKRNALSDSDEVQRANMKSTEKASDDKDIHIYIKQEKVWQEESNTTKDLNANIETNFCIGKELAQTLESSSRKRRLDDNLLIQGTEKRQRLEPPRIEVDVIAPSKFMQEEALPSPGELRASDTTDETTKEVSVGCVLLQPKEDQRRGTSPLSTCSIGIGGDEDMSAILKDVSKNFFTSRILESMEREEKESMFQRNSLDLDLVGPSSSRACSSEVPGLSEKLDMSWSKTRQGDSGFGIGTPKHKNLACASNMPQIYDVTGNGEMPEMPCKLANEDWNNIPPIISHKDELISPDAASRGYNHTRTGARNWRRLTSHSQPVRPADYQGSMQLHWSTAGHPVPIASPEVDTRDENWRTIALVKDTWPALARFPDATVSPEAASISGYSQSWKASGLPTSRTHNKDASQDARHQQQGRPNLPGATPYTREEALLGCHQELVSPTLGCDPQTPAQWNRSRHEFQDFPDIPVNSRGPPQAHGILEYQHASLQTANQPLTYDNTIFRKQQQGNRHSWPTRHEAVQKQSQVTNNHPMVPATLKSKMNYHLFRGRSSGKSQVLSDQQRMASTGQTNQFCALNGKPDSSYSHGNTMTPSCCNDFLKVHQNDTEQRNGPQASSKQWSVRGFQQTQNKNQNPFAGGLLQSMLSQNPSSQSGLQHMNFSRQQPLPSRTAGPTASSSLPKHHIVSQPMSLQHQQHPGTSRIRGPDHNAPSLKGLPAPSGFSDVSPSQREGYPCLPQIASVTSLHPLFLMQRT